MGDVRGLRIDDLPRLADLHCQSYVLGDQRPEEIQRAYVEYAPKVAPGVGDEDLSPSLVFEDSGVVLGFVLVAQRSALFRGQPIRVVSTSHLTVAPDARSTLAAVHLLRAVADAPHDLVYVDSSNTVGRGALKAAGFTQVPEYSLRWEFTFRRGADLGKRLGRRVGLRSDKVLSALDRAVAATPEKARLRVSSNVIDPPKGLSTTPLTPELVVSASPGLVQDLELHPDFSDAVAIENDWRRLEALRPKSTIVAEAVTHKDRVIGWYLVDIADSGTATVVALVTNGRYQRNVLACLISSMSHRGVISVEGRATIDMVFDLDDLKCRLRTLNASTSVHASNDDLVDCFRRRDAYLTMLEGEFLINPPEALPR